MRAVGYRQAWEFLDNRLSREEMIERGVIATRQLAKRQFTWLRSWRDLCWFYTDGQQRVIGRADGDNEIRTVSRVPLASEVLKYLGHISI